MALIVATEARTCIQRHKMRGIAVVALNEDFWWQPHLLS